MLFYEGMRVWNIWNACVCLFQPTVLHDEIWSGDSTLGVIFNAPTGSKRINPEYITWYQHHFPPSFCPSLTPPYTILPLFLDGPAAWLTWVFPFYATLHLHLFCYSSDWNTYLTLNGTTQISLKSNGRKSQVDRQIHAHSFRWGVQAEK